MLCERADRALYAAKRQGRDRVVSAGRGSAVAERVGVVALSACALPMAAISDGVCVLACYARRGAREARSEDRLECAPVRRSWSRRAVAIIGGTGLSLLPLIASGQVPRGPDFPVAPGGHPEAVAADAAGNFVVTWSAYQDGSQFGVYARRFDASGTPNGPEFRVNVYTTDSQHDSAVAAAPDGSVLYVWESNALDPGPGYLRAVRRGRGPRWSGVPRECLHHRRPECTCGGRGWGWRISWWSG